MKILLILFFSCCIATVVFAQEVQEPRKYRAIILDFGLDYQNLKEERFSSIDRYSWGYPVNIGYEWDRRNRNIIELRVSKNFLPTSGRVNFHSLKAQLNYTYLFKYGRNSNFSLGAYADLGSVFVFPVGGWSGNNTISYANWNSYGFSGMYHKKLNWINNSVVFSSQLSFPLFAYLIRPAYGIPYTENYLEDGTFDFQREGFTKAVILGGEFKTINTFQNIHFNINLSKAFGKKDSSIGIEYTIDFFQSTDSKNVRLFSNSVIVTSKIKL